LTSFASKTFLSGQGKLTQDNGVGNAEKRPDAEVEGNSIQNSLVLSTAPRNGQGNIAAAAHFQSLALDFKDIRALEAVQQRTCLGAGCWSWGNPRYGST
jgi:hypothetical protein